MDAKTIEINKRTVEYLEKTKKKMNNYEVERKTLNQYYEKHIKESSEKILEEWECYLNKIESQLVSE